MNARARILHGHRGMEALFVELTMTLNYVECHDNMTLFDKIMLSNRCESLE